MAKKKSQKSINTSPSAEEALKAQIAKAKESKANEVIDGESVTEAEDTETKEPTEVEEILESEEDSEANVEEVESQEASSSSPVPGKMIELDAGMVKIELDNVVEYEERFYRGVQVVKKNLGEKLLALDEEAGQAKFPQNR